MQKIIVAAFLMLALLASTAGAASLVVQMEEGIPEGTPQSEMESAASSFALRAILTVVESGVRTHKVTPMPYLGTVLVETPESYEEASEKLLLVDGVRSVNPPMEASIKNTK